VRNKYKPYVRRANGTEKAASFIVAFRLAFYKLRGKPYYVMVQRGFPQLAIECGPSKREVASKPAVVQFGIKTFKQWSKEIGYEARKS
jgi:hypothetical protein